MHGRKRRAVLALAGGAAIYLLVAVAAWAAPSITISRAIVEPGDTITITGAGFPPNKAIRCVLLVYNWSDSGVPNGGYAGELGERPKADSTGSFTMNVRVDRSRPGAYDVFCASEGTRVTDGPFRALTVDPDPRIHRLPSLFGDDTGTGVAINSVGQAAIDSGNSSTGADHAAVYSGGQTKAIGGNPMFAAGINDSAVVAGTKAFPDFHSQPFICPFNGTGCAGGVDVIPAPLGGTSAFGAGITNSSILAGTSQTTGDAASHEFFCPIQSGQCTSPQDPGTLGGDGANTTGIAGSGLVVGFSQTTGNAATHATDCPISGGACTLDDLGTLTNGQYSEALGADGAGDIVGDSNFQMGSPVHHGFLCTLANGSCPFKNLGALPGQTFSYAHAVTRWDGEPVVVGDSGQSAFVWSGNKIFQIDKFLPAGSPTITDVNGVNSSGQIIGTTGTGQAVIIAPAGMIGSVAYTAGGTLILHPQGAGTRSAFSVTGPVAIQRGGTVQWVNRDTVAHNVTDATGMGLYHSTSLAPGRGYAFKFNAAGSYPFKDTVHNLTGTVRVPMADAPAAGNTKTLFQLYWATGSPPTGFVYDVEVKRPGGTAFKPLLTGTKKGLTSFAPNAGAGSYYFEARLRNTVNGHGSGWSPPLKISVSP